jgi:hypothetical protein
VGSAGKLQEVGSHVGRVFEECEAVMIKENEEIFKEVPMPDIQGHKKWAQEHRAKERTIEGFWNNFRSYREEQLEEFREVFGVDFDESLLSLERFQLCLTLVEEDDRVHVVTWVRMVYCEKDIGEYRLVFNMDGTVDDDYFML